MSTEPAIGYASTLVTYEMDSGDPTPVGRRLADWRIRRSLSVADLATRAGVPEQLIEDLETGQEWIDQGRVLSSLAAGLQLDPAELTGQPYMPCGPGHSAVHSLGWFARRYLARILSAGGVGGEADEVRLAELADGVRAADEAGELVSAAQMVPCLLELIGPPRPEGAGRRAAVLRALAHVAVSRLLRRLGYRDLAWNLLSYAFPPPEARPAVLGEEVWLLLDMGQAKLAVARTARGEADVPAEVLLPLAVAHAVLGQEAESEHLLASAQEKAISARQRSQVASAGAFAAAEGAAYHDVLARAAGAAGLPAGDRSALLVLTASAQARLGQYGAAVEDLTEAESLAPLHVRLDPLARELVSVLPALAQEHAEALGGIAARLDMK
ncbi:helix-turn-helix transcriptional regulator [Streptomyces sp. NPDC001743]|uniref:helix-turn-helix domain-containing protein n=1 Tax=Streptomyces sp. NPDC001743 TaxID=3154397 RepID=UPI003326CB14